MTHTRRVTGLVVLAWTALTGCVAPGLDEGTDESTDGADQAVLAGSVGEAAKNSCTTSSVKGLSQQIIDEANCATPGAFALVPARANVTFGPAVFPYLEQPAKDRFIAAVDASPSTPITVNSMLRTVAQQHLLYRWYATGTCGIGLAAWPGTSNHETGLALDIDQYGTWKSKLTAKGFSWLGNSDPVHFDYVGTGAVDHRGLDVLAFQRLWNRNHPEDKITEDGDYGPQVEARMQKAPAAGFPKGAICGSSSTANTCQAVFVDICGSPFQADIEWLEAKGWTSGCDAKNHLYCPAEAVTRGQMAVFLALALNLPSGPDAFVDDDGSIYEASINALAKAGITSGCDAAKHLYCPDAEISREQMAAFLANALGLPAGPDVFVDDESSPYEAAINAVAAAGITSGCDAAKKLYCPADVVNRGMMASFLHRAFGD